MTAEELLSILVIKDIALSPRFFGGKAYWQAAYVKAAGTMLTDVNMNTDGWSVGTTPFDAVDKLLAGDTVYKKTEDGDYYLNDSSLPWKKQQTS